MAVRTEFGASRFQLELAGEVAALKSAEGGGVFADVIETPPQKAVGPPRYGDLVLASPFDAGSPLLAWAAQTMQGEIARKDGALVSVRVDGTIVARQDFFQALLAEITFPALDASSKEAAFLTARLRPELLRYRQDTGKVKASAGAKQKAFVASNFRVELGKLPTKKVSRVEAFGVKTTGQQAAVGGLPKAAATAFQLSIPDLVLRISMADSQPWLDFAQSFLIDGENGPEHELSGALVLLAPNLKDVMARVELEGVGLKGLVAEPGWEDEQVARLRAELYVESMRLVLPG